MPRSAHCVIRAREGDRQRREDHRREIAEGVLGELLAPEALPQEGAQRGGHIPGAQNVPWATAVAEDGRFKSADELKTIYEGKGLRSGTETIAYCRIGRAQRGTPGSCCRYLLGHERVRNYDGSWTEWAASLECRSRWASRPQHHVPVDTRPARGDAALLERFGIRDRRVLDAMARVPRRRFVSSADREIAYGDHALSIARVRRSRSRTSSRA
jgi:rhodanese-related sulfurtransferase